MNIRPRPFRNLPRTQIETNTPKWTPGGSGKNRCSRVPEVRSYRKAHVVFHTRYLSTSVVEWWIRVYNAWPLRDTDAGEVSSTEGIQTRKRGIQHNQRESTWDILGRLIHTWLLAVIIRRLCNKTIRDNSNIARIVHLKLKIINLQ